MSFVSFLDSTGQHHDLKYTAFSYNNLMEFIFDQGYEDWGDCKGRAWCATCHVKVAEMHLLIPPNLEEENRLNQLSNKTIHSRLACQIPLDKSIGQIKIQYVGDD